MKTFHPHYNYFAQMLYFIRICPSGALLSVRFIMDGDTVQQECVLLKYRGLELGRNVSENNWNTLRHHCNTHVTMDHFHRFDTKCFLSSFKIHEEFFCSDATTSKAFSLLFCTFTQDPQSSNILSPFFTKLVPVLVWQQQSTVLSPALNCPQVLFGGKPWHIV